MLEYFWETEYKFSEYLKKIFQEQYRRKYSLEGNGIFNLVTIDNKIYEIKYTKATALLSNDSKKATDVNKHYIIEKITNNLKEGTAFTINGGKYITFPIDKWIAKVEIIAKRAEPK